MILGLSEPLEAKNGRRHNIRNLPSGTQVRRRHSPTGGTDGSGLIALHSDPGTYVFFDHPKPSEYLTREPSSFCTGRMDGTV